MHTRRLAHIILLLVNLTVLIVLLSTGPDIHPDTAGYVQNTLSRGPLLPLLIDLCQLIAGGNALSLMARLQILFTTAGLAVFALSLHHFSGTSRLAAHVSFTILHALLLKFGNAILSEPLSFGLYALFMAALLGHIYTRRGKYAAGTLLAAALMLLTRPQFFYVFVFLLVYWGLLLHLKQKRRRAFLLVGIILLWGGLLLVRNAYNAAYNGVFGQYSAIGEHMLATQLYLASPGDEILFTDPEDRAFVGTLIRRTHEQKASIHQWDQSKSHYNKSILRIYFSNLMPVYGASHPSEPGKGDLLRDAYCKKLGIALMKAHPVRYAKLMFLKMYYGPFNYICLGLVLLSLSLAWYLKTRSAHALSYLSVSILSLFNYGMLIPFALIVKRYTLFSDAYQILFTALYGLMFLHGIPSGTSSGKSHG